MLMKSFRARSITEVALSTALIAVSAMISIPFPVPFTLQVFGVAFALFHLGGVRGSIAVCLYIFIGAFGIPVFSGFSGGFGRLFDAGGGFIWGFLIMSLVYLLLEYLLAGRRWGRIVAAFASLPLFYLMGSLWYASIYTDGSLLGYIFSLIITVAPFILPDAAKICLAYTISERVCRIVRKKPHKTQKND